jgi:hypothetical protein
MTKGPMTLWLLSLPLFRKSRGEIVNAAYIDTVLPKSLVVFKPESPGFSSLDWFLNRSTPSLKFSSSNGCEGVKTILHPLYSPNLTPADDFMCPRARSWLAVLSVSLGWGCPDHRQRQVRCYHCWGIEPLNRGFHFGND